MGTNFTIQLNGAPVTNKVVIPASRSAIATFTLVGSQGVGDAGKLVNIETSCVLLISAVVGNLDSTGKFSFVVGPSFDQRGNATLVISVSNKKKTLEIQFV